MLLHVSLLPPLLLLLLPQLLRRLWPRHGTVTRSRTAHRAALLHCTRCVQCPCVCRAAPTRLPRRGEKSLPSPLACAGPPSARRRALRVLCGSLAGAERARALFSGRTPFFVLALPHFFPCRHLLAFFDAARADRCARMDGSSHHQICHQGLNRPARSSCLSPHPTFSIFLGDRRESGDPREVAGAPAFCTKNPCAASWLVPASSGRLRKAGRLAASGGRRAGARPRRLVVRLAGSSGGVGGFGSWRGGAGRGQKHPAGRATRRCGSWRRRVPSSAISTHARLPPCLGAPGASPHPCPYPAYSHAPASAALGLLRAKRLSVSALPYADAHAGTNGGRGAMPHVREREHRAGPRQAVADTSTARAARREGGSFSDICGGVAFGCGHRGGSHWGRAAGAACGARQQSRGRVRA